MYAILTSALVMGGLSLLFFFYDIVDASSGRISLLEFSIAAGTSITTLFVLGFAIKAASRDGRNRARRNLRVG